MKHCLRVLILCMNISSSFNEQPCTLIIVHCQSCIKRCIALFITHIQVLLLYAFKHSLHYHSACYFSNSIQQRFTPAIPSVYIGSCLNEDTCALVFTIPNCNIQRSIPCFSYLRFIKSIEFILHAEFKQDTQHLTVSFLSCNV